MKEALVSPGPSVKIIDSPIPKPGRNDVVIKIAVSGTNPKDWKMPERTGWEHNSGDDMAGEVHEIGENVVGFHKGDRVAAFHVMRSDNGSFAEYGRAPAHTTFHLPRTTTFEQGATIPLAAATAAVGLFIRLGLPEPWTHGREDGKVASNSTAVDPGPLLVYGAASAVGAYVIQLAKRASIGPIIAVAGRGKDFVDSLIDRTVGDTIVDYRQDNDKVVRDIRDAVPRGSQLKYCFDAISEHNSYQNACEVLKETEGAKITLVLPGQEYKEIPPEVEKSTTTVGDVHTNQIDFATAWFALFGRALKDGWLQPHPHTVIPGGLDGVQEGLQNLKDGKSSATKYVYRIAETKSAGK